MAIVNFNNATQRVDMLDANLVAFNGAEFTSPLDWSWLTPSGHDVDLAGSGLTFDEQGRATPGTISRAKGANQRHHLRRRRLVAGLPGSTATSMPQVTIGRRRPSRPFSTRRAAERASPVASSTL